MRIIPVLDLLHGQIVRGLAGRRAEYRPIVSRLTSSSEPLVVARALREAFGLTQCYLADLDAIQGGSAALSIYRLVSDHGLQLWIDAGLRRADEAEALANLPSSTIVAGLETLAGPTELCRLCQRYGSERIRFSLDLQSGMPLGSLSRWNSRDPASIAAQAVAAGVGGVIVLDLAQVGMGQGVGTEQLCAELVRTYPDLDIIAGGGVRDRADLLRLREVGVHGVLVASALHDGRLTRDDLAGL